MLPTVGRNDVPTQQQNMVVYQYACHCVGRTSQRMQDRIKHVPKAIRNKLQQERPSLRRNLKISLSLPANDSGIGQHLSENKECAKHYEDKQLFILAKERYNNNNFRNSLAVIPFQRSFLFLVPVIISGIPRIPILGYLFYSLSDFCWLYW